MEKSVVSPLAQCYARSLVFSPAAHNAAQYYLNKCLSLFCWSVGKWGVSDAWVYMYESIDKLYTIVIHMVEYFINFPFPFRFPTRQFFGVSTSVSVCLCVCMCVVVVGPEHRVWIFSFSFSFSSYLSSTPFPRACLARLYYVSFSRHSAD